MRKIIGVIGYSDKSCETNYARSQVQQAILDVATLLKVDFFTKETSPSICSGLTDIGVPSIAYKFASLFDLHTIGIACSKATEYPCFNVDEKIIVGDNWGDESETFLKKIDALVRIGGGKQSEKEWETFTKMFPDKPAIYKPMTRDGKPE